MCGWFLTKTGGNLTVLDLLGTKYIFAASLVEILGAFLVSLSYMVIEDHKRDENGIERDP